MRREERPCTQPPSSGRIGGICPNCSGWAGVRNGVLIGGYFRSFPRSGLRCLARSDDQPCSRLDAQAFKLNLVDEVIKNCGDSDRLPIYIVPALQPAKFFVYRKFCSAVASFVW